MFSISPEQNGGRRKCERPGKSLGFHQAFGEMFPGLSQTGNKLQVSSNFLSLNNLIYSSRRTEP